jgi:hypothetical protein
LVDEVFEGVVVVESLEHLDEVGLAGLHKDPPHNRGQVLIEPPLLGKLVGPFGEHFEGFGGGEGRGGGGVLLLLEVAHPAI